MPLSEIKDEYKNKVVIFGNNRGLGLPLGQRADIDLLAIMAHESGNHNLIKLFKTLPPLADLKKAKTESELKRPAAPPVEKKMPSSATQPNKVKIKANKAEAQGESAVDTSSTEPNTNTTQ